MNEYWPNLTCKPGSGDSCDTFWKHEFQKHGACAKSMNCLDTDTEYFQNTVDFFKQLEVDRKTFKTHTPNLYRNNSMSLSRLV